MRRAHFLAIPEDGIQPLGARAVWQRQPGWGAKAFKPSMQPFGDRFVTMAVADKRFVTHGFEPFFRLLDGVDGRCREPRRRPGLRQSELRPVPVNRWAVAPFRQLRIGSE